MPSSDDSTAPRSNTWTLSEFGDLVKAWEVATSRPRDASAPTLHDAVFKHFVVFRGGTTRRNKAALTSKRSALKFSYLYIRDFDSEQKTKQLAPFFDLTLSERLALLNGWKKVNSSLVEITPVMYQGLMRIVSKGGDDEPVVPIRRRQKELQEATTTLRTDARPTRASLPVPDPSTVLGKRKQPAAIRASSNPWSVEEMEQLLEAWTVAVQTVCANASNEPMSIMHEMYRHFESLQGGTTIRNLSGLATRRRVLKQSYSRIAAFDKMQEMNGDVKFTDLPVATRLNVLRSWKNVNLLDLSADMYAKLHTIIALDTQAVALEDLRRTKGAGMKPGPVGAGRKGGRPLKPGKGTSLGLDDEHDNGLYASQPSSMLDREEGKGTKGIEVKTVKTVPETVTVTNDRPHLLVTQEQLKVRTLDAAQGKGEEIGAAEASNAQDQAMALKEPSVATIAPPHLPVRSIKADPMPVLSTDKVQPPGPVPFVQNQETYPSSVPVSHLHAKRALGTDVSDRAVDVITVDDSPVDDSPVEDSTLEDDALVTARGVKSDDVEEGDASVRKSSGRWGGKRKRTVHLDAPNGLLWDIHELAVLIQAWEKAARRVCASDPTDRLSLNREMYREFVALQGGYSVRNDTALAARRSSLKSSYAHISSFNESQVAKGEPCYHALPEDTRMSLLRSWKNRNSVDLTLDMYEALGRIVAMDEKLAELRHLRLPMSLKDKSGVDAGDDLKGMKGPKWSTDESFDLIQACANVMNELTDHDVAHRDRERLIFDAFVARRESRGDTDTPVRRDLRSMAQQWRCILASYSYIKACNDDWSEPAWFDMTSVQKRAYQQCTNVPSKFVDLNAEMFALVTKTSFLGVASPIRTPLRPSPVADFAPDGIALRPRSTRKKADVFWSSDSEPSGPDELVDDSRTSGGKKGTNWPPDEIWRLIQAWEEAVETTKGTRLTAALHETYALFTKRQRPLHRTRTLMSVKNRMIALNSSYLGISAYIGARGDRQAWFALSPDERLQEIRRWGNKTILDLNQDMYEALARILTRKGSEKSDGNRRKQGRMKDGETRSGGSKPEKYAAANWSKKELLLLSEACGELLEGRRSRRYVFEEEKDRFFRRYEELGGKNTLVAAVGLARYVLDSYEFIYFYNQRATETKCLTWFELDLEDREAITASMSKSYRNFNGLATVDEELYAVIDKLDAELRRKLGEEKKKTYKPPSDATSSRYVDIESVIEYCEYKTRGDGQVEEERHEDASEEAESSLADLSSDHDSMDSESSGKSAAGQADGKATRRTSSDRRGSDARDEARRLPRARSRDADAVDGSATLSITEIIHRQSRTFEAAVQQFRKESAVARKEHHAFLLQRIHETFPIDRGHGSFLERVAEGQSQALGELFQRLQHQRDVEKSQDDELMQQLFGSTVRM